MPASAKQVERVLAESDVPADPVTEESLEPDLPGDRSVNFRRPGFSRMRTSWTSEDAAQLGVIESRAEEIIQEHFQGAFNALEKLWRQVRRPRADPETGEILLDQHGRTLWETDEYGDVIEDWRGLDDRTAEMALFTITTHLVEWEQRAATLHARAMYSKVQWEERFAEGFLRLPGAQISGKPTVDDRTQFGNKFAVEERYFAVFQSAISRKADALIRSIVRIEKLLENRSRF